MVVVYRKKFFTYYINKVSMFITQFIIEFITMKKMGRPRRENKVVMTTVSIPEKIFFEFTKYKLSQDTWGDFFTKMHYFFFHNAYLEEQYLKYKEENEYLVEQLEQRNNRVAQLWDMLEATKKEKIELEKRYVTNR